MSDLRVWHFFFLSVGQISIKINQIDKLKKNIRIMQKVILGLQQKTFSLSLKSFCTVTMKFFFVN